MSVTLVSSLCSMPLSLLWLRSSTETEESRKQTKGESEMVKGSNNAHTDTFTNMHRHIDRHTDTHTRTRTCTSTGLSRCNKDPTWH